MGIEAITWQKIVPLGFMFFCILFNYTILRDTKVSLPQTAHSTPLTLYCFCPYAIPWAQQLLVLQGGLQGIKWRLTSAVSHAQDVLVVTAPGSGAETIPFLKTWVNLPMAIGFTVLYAKVPC